MPVTDAQVRKFMEEMSKHGKIGKASMKADFDRETGRKYLNLGKVPSQLAGKLRDWRTRESPFDEDWPELEEMLADAPALEAKALFEWLMKEQPEKYHLGQVRTFQRRVKQWRALKGPDKEVFFGQEHRPGEAMQTDFTWATTLGITIRGEAFPHLLCHPVLPFSNWEWATVCRSESMAAIKRGVQAAVFQLGRVTEYHQTDNSTAATHELRSKRVTEELAAMKPLRVNRLPEYTVEQLPVTSRSTIRIKHNTYSVPSRLIYEKVKVRIYEDRIEVFYGDIHQLTIERLLGRNGHRIDYRHIIWSLVDKPGAFPRYRYREELFPGLLFRRAYDALCEAFGHGREADLHYLRILHQAASVSESEVEAALALMLETHVTPDADRVQELVQPKQPEVPQMAPYVAYSAESDNLTMSMGVPS